MEILPLKEDFTVCKIKDITQVKFCEPYCFIGKTDEEISLVCTAAAVPENTIEREDGWKGFRIQGTLDFSLIGILSKISTLLAENRIGIFAVSTFNTDYIFTKKEHHFHALEILKKAGYSVI